MVPHNNASAVLFLRQSAKIKSQCPREQKTCLPKKFDEDADISKTICQPPPYGGVDIINLVESLYSSMTIV